MGLDTDNVNLIVWCLIIITGVLQLPLFIDALDYWIPGGVGRTTQVLRHPMLVEAQGSHLPCGCSRQRAVSYALVGGICFVYLLTLALAQTKVIAWFRDGMGYSEYTLLVHRVCMTLTVVNGLTHYYLAVKIPASPRRQMPQYVRTQAHRTQLLLHAFHLTHPPSPRHRPEQCPSDSKELDRRYYCRHCECARIPSTHHCAVCNTYASPRHAGSYPVRVCDTLIRAQVLVIYGPPLPVHHGVHWTRQLRALLPVSTARCRRAGLQHGLQLAHHVRVPAEGEVCAW